MSLVQSLALETGQRPVLGAWRESAAGHGVLEVGVRGQHVEHLLGVRLPVGGAVHHGPRGEPGRGQGQELRLDQPALVVPLLRPRVGEVDAQPGEGAGGEHLAQQDDRVAVGHPDVGQLLALREASRLPWPGVWTSAARMLVSGSAAAIRAVVSPMPKPISRTTGRALPKSSARSTTRRPSMSSPHRGHSRCSASACPAVTGSAGAGSCGSAARSATRRDRPSARREAGLALGADVPQEADAASGCGGSQTQCVDFRPRTWLRLPVGVVRVYNASDWLKRQSCTRGERHRDSPPDPPCHATRRTPGQGRGSP